MPKRAPLPAAKRKSTPPAATSPGAHASSNALSPDQKTVVRNAAVAAVVSGAVFLLSYLLLPKLFSFPTAALDRLIFVLRAEVFVFVWVVVAFRIVSSKRFFGTLTLDSSRPQTGEPRSVSMQFAHNTLEQAVMALVAHLALATMLEGAAMALLVGAIALFTIGRATFLSGMRSRPDVQSLGLMITTLPNVLCYCVAVIMMIIHALSFGA